MRIERIPAWVAETNAYLVVTDAGEALLVDAPPEPDLLGTHIAGLGATVVAILLTHGHIDHTGGAGKVSAESGASVYV